MVENTDIAIIFKREEQTDGSFSFEPLKVIEGYYDEVDEWFIDWEGNAYYHICTPMISSGNVYGCRKSIAEVVEKNKNISFSEIKNRILSFAKEHTYIKYNSVSTQITITNSEGETIPFKDKDSEYVEQISYGGEVYSEESETFTSIESEISTYEEEQEVVNEFKNTKIVLNPMEITGKIKENIVGQDDAIRTIATTIILNRNYPELHKKNLLVVGPTGTGKTAIFEELSKIISVPLTIFSVPGLSQAGYVGRDVDDILKSVLINSNYDINAAENSIVILDEIDKIAKNGNMSGNVSTEGVQNELLKLIEGDTRQIVIGQNVHDRKEYVINTSKITFVGIGAFQEVYNNSYEGISNIGFNRTKEPSKDTTITSDKISSYGIKRELIGRLPVLVELNNLTKENLKQILKTPNNELSKILIELTKLGIICSNIDYLYELIAADAIKKGIGARGLTTSITKIFTDVFYNVLSNPNAYQELIIGSNILEDEKDYYLKPRTTKIRIRKM